MTCSPAGSPQLRYRAPGKPRSTKPSTSVLDYSLPEFDDDPATMRGSTRGNHRKRTISFEGLKKQSSLDSIKSVQEVEDWKYPFKKNSLGYLLLIAVFVCSIYTIFFISVTSSNSRAWPWGLWYVISLMIDLAIFQPLYSILLAFMAFRHIHSGRGAGWLVRLMVGVDIISVLDRHVSLVNEFR